ncbi:hypothetical protein OCS_02885 [Ophiocordyceps sinensis CO18]|uniref:Histidine-specific methyltransferase SAM-dependent domain-containing protein n=1 Tax=Ophiocordyceps sinensis (strain Co18 / CGMCC 3.14243) TaxID=911162 RepID=T5AHS8_OPHSC|nr:hypothetical protein OCS_02885 [Ophiocordyceps sinensis CO18]
MSTITTSLTLAEEEPRLLNGDTLDKSPEARFVADTGDLNYDQASIPFALPEPASSGIASPVTASPGTASPGTASPGTASSCTASGTASPGTAVIDIRSTRASVLDFRCKILEGLRQPFGSKSLPSLLLWDEKGQSLYHQILATKHYYPYHVENELLKQRIIEIASTVASAAPDMLMELGAGNMNKTAVLLNSLDKHLEGPLVYYALDVDRVELEKSLSSLKERTNLRHIELCGLLGTYEDGAKWLSSPEADNRRKTLLWLGNSIANFTPHEAGDLLGLFNKTRANGSPNLTGFVIAVDGCQDESLIECAYDTPGGQSRHWIKYALESARSHMHGSEADELLKGDNWRVGGRWNSHKQRYESYLVAAGHLEGSIRGEAIHLRRGERVQIVASGKWTKGDVSSICSRQEFDAVKWWNSTEVDYGIYWLQPTLRQAVLAVDHEPGSCVE